MKGLAVLIINVVLLAMPTLVWAAGGEKDVPDMATRQVKVEGLSFINAFFAGWYNSNKLVLWGWWAESLLWARISS